MNTGSWIILGLELILVVVIALLPSKRCCTTDRALAAPPWKRGVHVLENHHGYWGIVGVIPYPPLQVVALIPILDDLRQHLIQLLKGAKSREWAYYKGGLHRLAAKYWYKVKT